MKKISKTAILTIGLMMVGGTLQAKNVQQCHNEYKDCKAKCSKTDKKCNNDCAKAYAECRGITVNPSSADTGGKRMPLIGP